jgi:FtsP/CotA-like multicopper oxidase with cupredoxin domain/ABC-type lipoprotein export system ATPase subunit
MLSIVSFVILGCQAFRISALRLCSSQVYDFNVSYFLVNPEGRGDVWVQGVNGRFPGPTINCKQGETLQVKVNNLLQTETVSIHWHGLEQRDSQQMDGALGITQCGIPPGSSFLYDILVTDAPGTYLYHGHTNLGHVAARGLFGALIVEPSLHGKDPWVGVSSEETVMVLSDWWPYPDEQISLMRNGNLFPTATVSAQGNSVGWIPFHNILINGLGIHDVYNGFADSQVNFLWRMTVKAGEVWRIRIINAGAVYAMRFRIDGHRMQVISVDGSNVEPYACDAVSMGPGERFDVLVKFDNPTLSWMRIETLEQGQSVLHGQVAVLQYTDKGVGNISLPPFIGDGIAQLPLHHPFPVDDASLVTVNCIDQVAFSEHCLPITALQRHSAQQADIGHQPHRTFEVAYRAFRGDSPAHLVRLLDIDRHPNNYSNQFDGEYVQFVPPAFPYIPFGDAGEHQNTLTMDIMFGDSIQVYIQTQDRAGYTWHLHGHKFAVLAQGFPDYSTDCDVLYCRHKPWMRRSMLPPLVNASFAPVKDTVYVPAGGWVVIQFKANNPGWWHFHCQMLLQSADGMGLIVKETPFPTQLLNHTNVMGTGLPTCQSEVMRAKSKQQPSCSCWPDPNLKLDNAMRSTYKCSRKYLCGHQTVGSFSPRFRPEGSPFHESGGVWWRWIMTCAGISIISFFLALKTCIRRQQRTIPIGLARHLNAAPGSPLGFKASTRIIRTLSLGMRECVRRHGMGDFKQVAVEWRHVKFSSAEWSGNGYLSPQSVVFLGGKAEYTCPWMHFLGGQKGRQSLISGQLLVAGKDVRDIDAKILRKTRVLISDFDPVRPHLTVLQLLEMTLLLRRNRSSISERLDHAEHLASVVSIFQLQDILVEKMNALHPLARVKVHLAQELLLPRPLVLVQNPFPGLSILEVEQLVALFNHISVTFGATIIFSTGDALSEVVLTYVSHLFFVNAAGPIFFGQKDEVAPFLTFVGMQIPCADGLLAWFFRLDLDDIYLATKFPLWQKHHQQHSIVADQVFPFPSSSGAHFVDRQTFSSAWMCFRTLFYYEFVETFQITVTFSKILECYGLGVLAGFVWWKKGSGETQTSLAEATGLLFFTCAVWTVPPVFQSLASTPFILRRTTREIGGDLYESTGVVVFALCLTCCICSGVWAPLWQVVTYTFADLGPTVQAMLGMNLVLFLNCMAMQAIGWLLGTCIAAPRINTVIGNIIAQFFMLINGFYTKLDLQFVQWLTCFSVPRYTFRALLKLQYTWKNVFVAHPMRALGGYISAELTPTFQTMHDREMNVMQSPMDESILPEVIALLIILVVNNCLFGIVLYFKVVSQQQKMPVRNHMNVELPRSRAQTRWKVAFRAITAVRVLLSTQHETKADGKRKQAAVAQMQHADYGVGGNTLDPISPGDEGMHSAETDNLESDDNLEAISMGAELKC